MAGFWQPIPRRIYRPAEKPNAPPGANEEFARQVDAFIQQNRPALKELARSKEPRVGWDSAFAAMASQGEDRLLDNDIPTRVDEEDWQWNLGAPDLFTLLEQVRVIARNGLNYATDVYDRERYQRLLEIASQTYSDRLGVPAAAISEQFMVEIGHITPKVGSSAAIFNEQGEILLMERANGSGWCLPCGWLEPAESPAEAVVRETREETGLEIRAQRLVDVFTRKPCAAFGPFTTVSVVYLCQVTGGALRLSYEGRALRYWKIDEVTGWHATHEQYARAAHAAWCGSRTAPTPAP
jgi:ADP-ribose pyrophosphatase YjhB (NUDIX family)